MDFVEGLPPSNSYNTILVVVDCLTKFVHFIAIKHPFTAAHIARVILDSIVTLHGLPTSIVTDRDRIFVSAFGKNCSSYTTSTCSSAQPITPKLTDKLNV
jgi:hypothetical protein